jgi:hypothetical protein
MAIKHLAIRPVRHAGIAGQSKIYQSAAAIVKGAPLVFSSGQVTTATDDANGALGAYVGFAEHAVSAANKDCRVALCLPGQRFVGSLTSLAAGGTDAGAGVHAIADIGTLVEIHLDAGTGIWVLGATGGTNAAARITALIDPVGATSDDTPTFGAVGGGGVGETGAQDPTGSNSGMALVEFVVVAANGAVQKTIY